ncbi:MAG: acyl-CoA dehydratase activase [Candidatus Helarchaeota archaeon]
MIIIPYFLGVDVGTSYVKTVLLENDAVVTHLIDKIEGNPGIAGKNAIKKTAEIAGLKEKKIRKNMAGTGIGIQKCPFIKHQYPDMVSVTKGTVTQVPSARTIIDVGALSIKAISLADGSGKIKDYSVNDRCAGGSGMFLELISKALEMSLEDISKKPLEINEIHHITSQCSIFAESEVIYLKNEGYDKVKIAGGVNDSIAGRTLSIVRKLDLNPDIVITGGMANNEHFVKCLSNRLGIKLTRVERPEYVGAHGAALLARDRLNGGK